MKRMLKWATILWRLLLVVIILLLISSRVFFVLYINHENHTSAALNLKSSSNRFAISLEQNIEVYADTLYSARAFVLASNNFNRANWSTFFKQQDIAQRYPDIYSLAYVTLISSSQQNAFTNQLNADRLPTDNGPISIYPKSNDSQSAVVTYLAPQSADQQGIGYDLMTSPARAETMKFATDSGLPQATPELSLIPDNGKSSPGVLLIMPLYKPINSLDTVAERQSATSGYAILALDPARLLNSLFTNSGLTMPLSLTVTNNGQQIYRSGSGYSALRRNLAVNVAGQTWRLSFRVPANYGLGNTANQRVR